MKKSEIKVGGHYTAKVNGKLVTVRVDAVRSGKNDNIVDSYDVTNLSTGRKTTFRSAQKFRAEVRTEKNKNQWDVADDQQVKKGGDRPDPTPAPTAGPTTSTAAFATNASSAAPPTARPTSPLAQLLKAGITKVDGDTAPHVVVEARAGTGKCLGRGTPVLMFDGSVVAVEDVVEGDLLMGPDSTSRTVLSVAAGVGPLYEICPVKGDSWVCNDAHVLTLMGTNHVMGQIRDVDVTTYLAEQYDSVPHCNSWKLFRVGVEFKPDRPLRIAPYLVGLWMGDGSRGGCDITNRRPEIQNYCSAVAKKFGLECKVEPDSREGKNTSRIRFVHHSRDAKGHKPGLGDNCLLTFFRSRCSVGVLKKIPDEYLTASRTDRMALLAGIIDTDGESTGNSNTFITVTGELYRDDLLFLARSLGFAAYCVSSSSHTCASGKVSNYFHISVAGDLETVPTLVRKYPSRRQVKRVLVTGFEVEDAGDGEYFGFTLDGDGRFLLGDFTVAHNTTTLVEGLKELKGIPSALTPSPQQRAVWDAICMSADRRHHECHCGHQWVSPVRKVAATQNLSGESYWCPKCNKKASVSGPVIPGAKTVCFVAFNKAIATELQRRVPPGCDAMTMHSYGYKAVMRTFGRQEPSAWAVKDIIAGLLGRDWRDLARDPKLLTVVKATEELVGLCKQNLTPLGGMGEQENLDRLASYYDIDLNGSRAQVFELVPRVLEKSKEPKGKIAFDDMIYLPIVLDLPLFKYDLLLVDEAQDLNRCQQALAKRAGHRLILCGDPKQAIYGFAGADSESMARMERELSEGAGFCPRCCNADKYRPTCEACHGLGKVGTPGCLHLPLTVTRRCGKAIVAEARKIVPDFEAHPDNPEGRVLQTFLKPETDHPDASGTQVCTNYAGLVRDGDMILCRCNAPLVSQCFKFLRAGRKATIQGRDIGAGLIATVKKMIAATVVELVGKLSDWLHTETAKEQAKRQPSENKITALQDRYDCLVCFTEGAAAVDDVVRKIEAVFTDDKVSPGIKLSSIHKAKGLESDRVFFLRPPGVGPRLDKMQPWELEQESNLTYVAITRAISELVFVS